MTVCIIYLLARTLLAYLFIYLFIIKQNNSYNYTKENNYIFLKALTRIMYMVTAQQYIIISAYLRVRNFEVLVHQ